MSSETPSVILTANVGSSSLKFSLYRMRRSAIGVEPILSGKLDRIAIGGGRFVVWDNRQAVLVERQIELPNYEVAIKTMLDWVNGTPHGQELRAAGHRVVHGGRQYNQPQLVTSELLQTLKDLIPLAPDHLPQEIEAIEILQRLHPNLKQVVCFDTAFHRTMPRPAQLYGLPIKLADDGIIRYGFHGLSYEYIVQELSRQIDEQSSNERVIVAHFGNGASLAAIRDGKSIDTSMGFTLTGGIAMSTRSGDLDPGVILYLLQKKNYSSSQVSELVTRELGSSGCPTSVRI